MSERRRAAETRGRAAETLAALMLQAKGYRILERRFASGVGEVDLIVRRGRVVAFVEVKARPTVAAAIEAVTPRQRARILRAAGWYLAHRPGLAELDLRFDVVCVAPRRFPRHIAGAWTA